MTTVHIEQLNLFSVFCISGLIIGIIFDIFRIIRRSFKISDFHTYVEDIILGIIIGIFLIYMLYVYNSGNFRFYMIIALFIGFITYILTISKYFIRINVKIITFLKKFINKTLHIIFLPIMYIIKTLTRIFNKPYMILIINIKKIKNVINYQKYQKKLHKKKDFIK